MTDDNERLREDTLGELPVTISPDTLAFLGKRSGELIANVNQIPTDEVPESLEGFVGYQIERPNISPEDAEEVPEEEVVWVRKEEVPSFADGKLLIDYEKREVKVNDEKVKFTKRIFDLLAYFSKNPNRAISHKELYQNVWNDSFDRSSELLSQTVALLRNNLGDVSWVIVTLRGVGYMFDDSSENNTDPVKVPGKASSRHSPRHRRPTN
jgi:DNA-binding winged helix-turn-helix (wHTH) protein